MLLCGCVPVSVCVNYHVCLSCVYPLSVHNAGVYAQLLPVFRHVCVFSELFVYLCMCARVRWSLQA